MDILIIGDFPGKRSIVSGLRRNNHDVIQVASPNDAHALGDERGWKFPLFIVPEGRSGKWMGTALTEGLKSRKVRAAVVFILDGIDDSLELIKMQFELEDHGLIVFTMHTPLRFEFVVEQLRRSKIEVGSGAKFDIN